MEAIKFEYKGKEEEGILINQDKDRLTIKLSSGYNIIVKESEIKILEKKELERKDSKKPEVIKHNKDLPTITILHTGGTIASKVDYSTGAVVAQFTEEEIKNMFPELKTIANIDSKLVGNMQSEMMNFSHWNKLAKAASEAVKKGTNGIIITHGTDILHISAAALGFLLKDIEVPVLLVGSQRSSDRPSSDSASNVICAASFIAQSYKEFQGVALCMHESSENDDCNILPCFRSRKMHTSRRDTFKTINAKPIAKISFNNLKIEKYQDYPTSKGTFKANYFDEKLKVGILKAHPQMYSEEIKVYENFDGLVLELFGIGHMPTTVTDEGNKENELIYKELTKLSKKIPVVGAAQTLGGRINMNVYTPGRQLLDIGILGNEQDLIPEIAFVKLSFLLSTQKDQAKVRELYSTNIAGELKDRSEYGDFEE